MIFQKLAMQIITLDIFSSREDGFKLADLNLLVMYEELSVEVEKYFALFLSEMESWLVFKSPLTTLTFVCLFFNP
jgi:hypothetical protein